MLTQFPGSEQLTSLKISSLRSCEKQYNGDGRGDDDSDEYCNNHNNKVNNDNNSNYSESNNSRNDLKIKLTKDTVHRMFAIIAGK